MCAVSVREIRPQQHLLLATVQKSMVSPVSPVALLLAVAILVCVVPLSAADRGSKVEYVGGTLEALSGPQNGTIHTNDPISFIFQNKSSAVRVPYTRINLIEYGQKVNRRLVEAALISPVFLLSKKRAHFLTVGYETDDGIQQAMLFRVDKDSIRAVLVSLEARTGIKVTYQDEEARKGGKG